MNYSALSLDCFHCVQVRPVNGRAEAEAFMSGIRGLACPLCGVRCQTFLLLLDRQDVENRLADADGWGRDSGPLPGFARFATTAETTPGGSAAAERLRGQVSAAAAERRRRICQAVTDLVQAEVSYSVGRQAWTEGRLDDARRALTVCAATDSPEASQAAIILGGIDLLAGRREAAASWYRRVTADVDPEVRASGFYLLGGALDDGADTRAAESALQAALDCGDTPIAGRAAIYLGVLVHERTGDWDPAVRLWEYAYAKGPEEARLVAAFHLGRAWTARGRRRKARRFFAIATASTEPGIAAGARAALDG